MRDFKYQSNHKRIIFMKAPKFILASVALVISATAFSQDTTKQKQDTTRQRQDTTRQRDSASLKQESASKWGVYPPAATQNETAATDNSENRQLTDSSNRQHFPAPNFGNYYIPVLGSYNSAEDNTEKNIVIAGDEKNPGKVWIDGLASERIYALLKEAPGTYKIPNQKNAKEGTLIYDEESKEVSICVGCGYKDKDPENVIANNQSGKKSAKSVLSFTGTKTDQGTVSNQ
jgi:hypothetical protein